MLKDPRPDDINLTFEWLLVRVQFEVLKAANDDTAYDIVDGDFRVVSLDGRVWIFGLYVR